MCMCSQLWPTEWRISDRVHANPRPCSLKSPAFTRWISPPVLLEFESLHESDQPVVPTNATEMWESPAKITWSICLSCSWLSWVQLGSNLAEISRTRPLTHRLVNNGKWLLFKSLNLGVICYTAVDNSSLFMCVLTVLLGRSNESAQQEIWPEWRKCFEWVAAEKGDNKEKEIWGGP